MGNPSVFEAQSYKTFINNWLFAQPKQGHGLRKKIAEVIGTQTGFVTQVLSGDLHFSLEQAIPISELMGLGREESKFFILLLQLERAGTAKLRQHFQHEMKISLEVRKDLSKRLEAPTVPTELDQVTYFSSWIYSAVHALCTCSEVKTKESIAQRLQVPLSKVAEVIDFLERSGLVSQGPEGFRAGQARMHLGKNSPLLLRHHGNWRTKALQALENENQENLHYSSVISLSAADYQVIRELVTRAIADSKKVVQQTQPESIYGFVIDLFKVDAQ